MYTLDQLAHFDRCLFVDNLRGDLHAIGTSHAAILAVDMFCRSILQREGRSPGVVEIYQQFIGWKEVEDALNTLLTAHVSRYP